MDNGTPRGEIEGGRKRGKKNTNVGKNPVLK